MIPDGEEMQLLAMVAIAFVVVSLVPVTELASRFAPFLMLDRIPYSDLLVRAAMIASVLYVGRRMLQLA